MIVIIETTTDEMKNAENLSKLLIDKKIISLYSNK